MHTYIFKYINTQKSLVSITTARRESEKSNENKANKEQRL
jgi:hypothetical protein